MQRINLLIEDKKYNVLKKYCKRMKTSISKLIRELVFSEVDKNSGCNNVTSSRRCINLRDSISCVECVDGDKLDNCFQSILCYDSSFLYRCYNMKNSEFCIDCESLEGAKYYYKNKPISDRDFREIEKLILDKEVC